MSKFALMKTAVVILNWNGKKFLDEFLPALLLSMDADSEVVVADNASTDGSVEFMSERYPDVRLIRFSENFGFTGGYNRALSQIQAEYYVLINSDIEVPAGWLQPLTAFMDNNPDCGICAPKLHSWRDREFFEYAGAAGGLIDSYGYPFCRGRVLGHVEKDEGQYDNLPNEVFWATGACLMIRSGLYHRLKGLDERFFAHMEEIDLCWRAQLAGYKVCVVTDSMVWHVGGGSLANGSPWKLYLNYRNNLLMLGNNLAKTLSLKLMHEYMEVPGPESGTSAMCRRAAEKGFAQARRRIFTRMLLDGCAAIVYLLTFRWKYFTSVWKAHKDYRKLKKEVSLGEIENYLTNYAGRAEIRGMYEGWMIPEAMSGKKIICK